MAREPLADLRVLVSGIVVNDRMDRLPLGNVCVDCLEKADELLMSVELHVATENGAVENVERGEQRGRAVALVVVRHGSGPARFHRQTGLGAGKGLVLTFFFV